MRKGDEVDTKALRKGFGSAAGSKAQIAAYHEALVKAADEIDRLTAALENANAQAEHFEREWYLRGDEIEKLKETSGADRR